MRTENEERLFFITGRKILMRCDKIRQKEQIMKKVTLLGDSIRQLGYGKRVEELLKGEYEVFQPEDNCRFAKYTLRMLFDYKDQIAGSDVIHWNNGLWDVCDLFGDGQFSSVEEYCDNMLRIADILLKITPNVIFATTTPVRDGYQYQANRDIAKLNEAIVPLLKEKNVAINDLYGLVYPVKETILRDDDLIHLNDEGIELCAKQVADAIRNIEK